MGHFFKKILPEVASSANFQKLWWAQILGSIAFNTLNYVLIIRIAERTQSNTAVSLFILSFTIPALLFGLVAGVWVDRLDRRLVIIATNAIRAALVLLFFLADQYNFWLVYLIAVAMSMVTQFFIPAEAAKLASLVPKKLLNQANSLFTLSLYASLIVGPILAGPALKYFSLSKIFIALTIIYAGAALLAALLPKDPVRKASVLQFSVRADLLDAFSHIRSNQLVWGALVLMAFAQTLIATLIAISPGYARAILGISLNDTSLLMLAPAAAGLIVGSLFLSRLGTYISNRILMLAGIFLAGAELIIMGIARSFDTDMVILPIAIVLLFALGVSTAMAIVPSQTTLQTHTPEYLRGRVYGILGTMVNGASIVPVLFAGVLADTLGVATFITIMGISVFLTGFYARGKLKAN